MAEHRPETVVEAAIRLGREGAATAESVLWALAASDLVVLTPAGADPRPETLEPLVVHRDDVTFVAAFTASDRVPADLGRGRVPVTLPASLLLRGIAPEVGLVVNPGTQGFEVPAEGLAGFRAQLEGGRAAPRIRYFVREHLQDGALVPFALLRRVDDGGAVRDEVLRDVGQWAPDRAGSVDRALRLPLESDLEEVTAAQAAEVEGMVADRRYRPLSR